MIRKMSYYLVNRFILWLKKIFHICPVKVTPQPEKKTGEVLPQKGKPAEMPLLKNKTIEGALLPEQRPGTLKPLKPYKKKLRTEETKVEPIKPPTTEREPSTLKQKKTIYLGNTQRRRRSLTGTPQKPTSNENVKKETAEKVPEEKEFTTTVESPYIEINLDNAEVYMILPKQQFKTSNVDETPQQTSYSIDLNGKQQEVLARITTNKDRLRFVEEKRILLEKPLVKFQVASPDEIQGGDYNYNHKDKELYTFVAIGNNLGRMYYLNDKESNINPIPRRVNWVLLHEEFELQAVLGPSDITEDIWIWGEYQPFRIDLSEIDALVIKNKISGEEKSFTLQSTYYIEGDQIIEDDYKKECPLFTGKTIKIIAPYENMFGCSVWIQNKTAGYKIKENWTGEESLILRLPDDLPCEFGEFQIDICQQYTRIPDETLFFRFMPFIELNYPKELIIPNPKSECIPLTISIRLDSTDEWGLEYSGTREIKVKLNQHNFYEIELPPEENTFRFTLAKTSRPESIVNFQITIPRLKWKTSKQKVWSGISQKIERNDLKSGEPWYLFIQTNDFDNKYDLLALIEANSQKLQEGKFIRKGIEYCLELNQFFDTITHNKDELILKVEVRKAKDNALLGKPEILYFPTNSVMEKPPLPKYDLIQAISLQKICYVLRRLKDTHPKERANSKNILQHYYRKIKDKKRDKRSTNKDKRIFVIKSLAFIKYIIDIYGERAQIKGQKKWRKRIDLLQQEYPEEIKGSFDTISRR